MVWVILDRRGNYFHFWDRNTYGEPQFGDAYHARKYTSLAGCLSRVRALRAIGMDVIYKEQT